MRYFFGVMDKRDKRSFVKYVIVLLCGSIFAVLGVGSVIPFINVLIQPDKITSLSFFQSWAYTHIVLFFTIILIAAFAIKNMVAFLLLNYQFKFLFGLMAKIQQKLFTGYMALNYEYHLNKSTPDLIKNVNNETTMLSSYVVAPLGSLLTELFASIFVLVVLLVLNAVFTLLVTGLLLIGIFIFMKIIKVRMNYYSELRTKVWSSMTDNVLSGLSGIKESKLYHCESHFLKKFNDDAVLLKGASTFQQTYSQAPRMLIEFIGLTVVMGVLCGFVLLGNSPKEMFILLGVFGVAAAQLLPSLNRLTQALVQIKYGMPALKTIYHELQQVSDVEINLLTTKTNLPMMRFSSTIQVKNLHYSYQDGTAALNGIEFEIPKNKRIALVGESGAGKTTLVDLLIGLYSPSQGQICVDGIAIASKQDLLSFQKLFAYIPQHIILYDKSIKQNIAFGVDEENIDTERVWHCLEQAHMKTFVQNLKDKENACIGEGGVRLSGGQRQRIGIARALYRQPQILVMDEATSALDNQTEREVTSVLAELKDLTIITIAHRLTTIKNYDLIYVLNQGVAIASGTYNELMNDCVPFQNMVNAVGIIK